MRRRRNVDRGEMNGAAEPHPQFLIERQDALREIARQLHSVIAIHRYIAHHAAFYNLDLELPSERVYLDAISKCSRVHKQEKTG